MRQDRHKSETIEHNVISNNMAQALYNMAEQHDSITACWDESSISLLLDNEQEVDIIVQVAGTPSTQYPLGRHIHVFYLIETD